MSILDKLPHRQLINRSLRKKAEILRRDIDAYQKRYDEQYQKATDELKSAEKEYAAKLEKVKQTVLEKLSEENDLQKALSSSILEYVTTFFNKQLLSKQKDLVQLQIISVNQYIGFLSEQMHLIGDEIEHLVARRDLLTQQAEIADIIRLIQLSGNQLEVDESADAKALLYIVLERMNGLDDDDHLQRNVLLNVRTLLEERVTFLTEIHYITWVVAQKIQLSKELRSIREEKKQVIDRLNEEVDGLSQKIKEMDDILLEKAREIRYYWAKRLVELSIEIELAKDKKATLVDTVKEKYEERSSAQSDINWMKSTHSADNWRWDRHHSRIKHLSNEIKSLSSDIDSVKSDISRLMEEQKNWKKSRSNFLRFLKSLNVFLLFIGAKGQTDEEIYVETRVQKLAALDAEGKSEAERVYQAELAEIEAEKESVLQTKAEIIQEISDRLEPVKRDLEVAEDELKRANEQASKEEKERLKKYEQQYEYVNNDLTVAYDNLAKAHAADHRFVFVRIFSDTEEVTKAKGDVAAVKRRKARIEAAKVEAQNALKKGDYSEYQYVQAAQERGAACKQFFESIVRELKVAQEEYDQTDASYNQKIRSLHPVQNKPSSKERSELSNLQKWQESQRKWKERKNESKN